MLPLPCTNLSIFLQLHYRHLQSMSGRIFVTLDRRRKLTLSSRAFWSFTSDMHSPIFRCSLQRNQSLYWKLCHLAERKWTISSNFSFLLNWAARPDNLVHMCRLSGSNWGRNKHFWQYQVLFIYSDKNVPPNMIIIYLQKETVLLQIARPFKLSMVLQKRKFDLITISNV